MAEKDNEVSMKLKNLLYGFFDLPLDFPEDDFDQEYMEDWSSSKHLSLIMEIEHHFGVSFEIDEVEEMTTFQLIVEYVTEKLN